MSMQVLNKTKLTTISSTETDLMPGNIAYDEGGTKYIKCKALGTVAVDMAVMVSTATAGTTERTFLVPGVIITAEIIETDVCLGWTVLKRTATAGAARWCKSFVARNVKTIEASPARTGGAFFRAKRHGQQSRRLFPPLGNREPVAEFELASSAEDHRALDDVLQFSDVARPGIDQQGLHRVVRDGGDPLA